MNRNDYMKHYRKTHPEYVEKERIRKRLNIKRWTASAEERLKEKEQAKVIRWMYNYWKTLKEHGMTERQLIIKFDNYLKSLVEGRVNS